MVNYGLILGIVEDIKTSAMLGSMASVAAFIKGIEVAGLDAKGVLGALLTFYWGGAMVGRFVGSALMRRVKPSTLLAGAGLLAMLLIVLSISSEGVFALLSVLAVGVCNSIMFPTIFTLAIEDLGEAKPQGSGILCTAIAGGAFIPPAMGGLVDTAGFALRLPAGAVLFVHRLVCRPYGASRGRMTGLRQIRGSSQDSLTSQRTFFTPGNFFAGVCVLLTYEPTHDTPILHG